MMFIKYKHIFLGIAGAVMTAAIGILLVFGLPLGIDFTGGSLTEVSYEERPEQSVLDDALAPLALGQYSLRQSVSESGRDGYVLRTRDLTEDERIAVEAAMRTTEDSELERYAAVGPIIGEELKRKSAWAIAGVVAIIILYVAYAFRGMGRIGRAGLSSWHYGVITIVALLHDVLVPTAVFAILGLTMGAEADVLFVMALLAVLGYSVNDTIVVFDRVRENLEENYAKAKQLIATYGKDKQAEANALKNEPFAETVGRSVEQTLARSINTSITTILSLTALYFLGGDVTEVFALTLLAGVLAGTYSSIALANPLLVLIAERLPERDPDEIQDGEKKKRPAPGIPIDHVTNEPIER